MNIMGLYFEKYDSLNAFEKSFERAENPVYTGKECESKEKGGSFCGTESFEEALSQLKNGRPEIISELKKDAQKVSSSGVSFRTIRKNDFSGYAPNVGRALAGLPRDMRKKKRVQQPTKTVTLIYSCSAPGSVRHTDLDKAGRAFFRLAYNFEMNGIKTRLFVLPYAGEQPGNKAFCLVKLKDFSGRFDLTRLSFPLTSPSMLRRFGFRFLETVPGLTDTNFRYDYGSVIAKDNLKKLLNKTGDFTKGYKLFYPVDFIDNDFDEHKVLELIDKEK